jgi:hypothetical protein
MRISFIRYAKSQFHLFKIRFLTKILEFMYAYCEFVKVFDDSQKKTGITAFCYIIYIFDSDLVWRMQLMIIKG